MIKIDYSYPTENFDQRPVPSEIDTIILHFTNQDFETSLNLLTQPSANSVSCHYLIDLEGTIFQLLEDNMRAWHAGQSYWRGRERLNDNSIGIEIINYNLLPYEDIQIMQCIKLCRMLMKKYNIVPTRVLGHSDIAPYRKKDPGAHFPWNMLAKEGIVAKVSQPNHKRIKITQIDFIQLLAQIGYDTRPLNNNPEQQVLLIKNFQRRFCQDNVTGIFDLNTQKMIENIAKIYCKK